MPGLAVAIAPRRALAQQPFVTDGAEVGPSGVWHVEVTACPAASK